MSSANNVTLADAQANLAAWIAADQALALGKSYTIGGRQLNRANAAEVAARISYWTRQVKLLEANAAGSGNGSIALATWS